MSKNTATVPTPEVNGQTLYIPSDKPGEFKPIPLAENRRLTPTEIAGTRRMLHEQLIDVEHSPLTAPQMYRTMFTLRVNEIRNSRTRNCTLAEAKADAAKEEDRARELGNAHPRFKELTHRMYEKMQLDAVNCPTIKSNKIPGLTRTDGSVVDEEGFRTGMVYLMIQDLRESPKADRTDADNANVALAAPTIEAAQHGFAALLIDGNDQLRAITPPLTDADAYDPRTVAEHENAFTVLAGLAAKSFSRTRLAHNSGVGVMFLLNNNEFGATAYVHGDAPANPDLPPANPDLPPANPDLPPANPNVTPAPEVRSFINVATRRLLQVGVGVGAFYLWNQLRQQEAALIEGHLPQAHENETLPPWQWFIRQAGTTGFALVSGAFALRTAWQVAGRVEQEDTLGRAALIAAPIVGPAAALFIGRTLYERFGRDVQVPSGAAIFAGAMAGLNGFWERVAATPNIVDEAGPAENGATRGRSRLHQFAFNAQLYTDVVEDLTEVVKFYRTWADTIGVTTFVPAIATGFDKLQTWSEWIGRRSENLEHEARLWRKIIIETENSETTMGKIMAAIGYLINPLNSLDRLPDDADDLEISIEGKAIRKAFIDKLKSYRPDEFIKNRKAKKATPPTP